MYPRLFKITAGRLEATSTSLTCSENISQPEYSTGTAIASTPMQSQDRTVQQQALRLREPLYSIFSPERFLRNVCDFREEAAVRGTPHRCVANPNCSAIALQLLCKCTIGIIQHVLEEGAWRSRHRQPSLQVYKACCLCDARQGLGPGAQRSQSRCLLLVARRGSRR